MLNPRSTRTLATTLASTLVAGLLTCFAGPATAAASAGPDGGPTAGSIRAADFGAADSEDAADSFDDAADAYDDAADAFDTDRTASADTAPDAHTTSSIRTTTQAVKSSDGATIVSSTWVDQRTLDLTVKSPAAGGNVPVRLLLPPGWSPTATRTYPVLYLLQGAHDDYTSWTRETDIEAFSADRNMIVAMPGAGPTGLPTRWLNGGKNSPDYETFQVTELNQLLQRGYRASGTRAVAGVSTGGYGALIMAAHHPGAFTAAASYSGIPDTTFPGMPIVMAGIVARENLPPFSLWGDPVTNAALWARDNPYTQADRLRGTALFVSCGSGEALTSGDLGGILESALWQPTQAFVKRLNQLGVPVQTDLYQGGEHAWSSWQTEFAKSWPMLAAGLGLPA